MHDDSNRGRINSGDKKETLSSLEKVKDPTWHTKVQGAVPGCLGTMGLSEQQGTATGKWVGRGGGGGGGGGGVGVGGGGGGVCEYS